MKTVVLFGAILALVVTIAIGLPWMSRSASVTAGSGLLGDANCDGAVGAIDVALLLQQSAGLLQSIPCPANGDVSGDGMIGAVDAALILQYVAGLLATLDRPSMPPMETSTPAPEPTAKIDGASLVYLGSDLDGLGADVEVILSADGLTVERFTLEGLCRVIADERGHGLFLWSSIPVREFNMTFSYSNPNIHNYKVHGRFSVDGQTVSGEAWAQAPCAIDPIDWEAYLQ